MRPVQKAMVGSLVTVEGQSETIKRSYHPYKNAKKPLLANIGEYCSYCEVRNPSDLHIEHVQPKSTHPEAEETWCNFLLACSTCNGNKGAKDVALDNIHLPHRNNTFLSFQYLNGGVIRVNPSLSSISQNHAKALLCLVGLDKTPSADRSNRWSKRFETWNQAQRYLSKYHDGKVDVDTIIDLAKAVGHWSIWFTIFKGEDEVLKRLISDFEGTANACFNADNHYEPIYRNPNNPDPV